MLRTLIQAFTSPVAGPAGFALSIVMCGLLVATAISAERNEAVLRARVVALTAENQRNGLALHARLAACYAHPADVARKHPTEPNKTPRTRPQRLASHQP